MRIENAAEMKPAMPAGNIFILAPMWLESNPKFERNFV